MASIDKLAFTSAPLLFNPGLWMDFHPVCLVCLIVRLFACKSDHTVTGASTGFQNSCEFTTKIC